MVSQWLAWLNFFFVFIIILVRQPPQAQAQTRPVSESFSMPPLSSSSNTTSNSTRIDSSRPPEDSRTRHDGSSPAPLDKVEKKNSTGTLQDGSSSSPPASPPPPPPASPPPPAASPPAPPASSPAPPAPATGKSDKNASRIPLPPPPPPPETPLAPPPPGSSSSSWNDSEALPPLYSSRNVTFNHYEQKDEDHPSSRLQMFAQHKFKLALVCVCAFAFVVLVLAFLWALLGVGWRSIKSGCAGSKDPGPDLDGYASSEFDRSGELLGTAGLLASSRNGRSSSSGMNKI